MSDAPPQEPRPLQFSISTVMGVTAGVAILLSLSMWNPLYGSGSAIVLVCGLWATMAARAGYRRLSYYLIGVGMGPIALAVALTPIVVLDRLPVVFRDQAGMGPVCLLACVWSTLITIRLLRKAIREPGGLRASVAMVFVYLMALVIPVVGGLHVLIIERFQMDFVLGALVVVLNWVMAGSFFAVIAGTVYMPLAWPVAYCCVRLLRYVDPLPRETDSLDTSDDR